MRSLLANALVLAALVCAALLFGFYQYDMGPLEKRLEGQSRTVSLPSGIMEFAERGSGPPVLAIHGSGGGFDQALEMLGELAQRGYRVIAPSRFGYLGSPMPKGASPELQADAFADLLDSMDVRKAVIIGGSAGALSATQFAIRHPDRCLALVLTVPALYAPDRPPNTNGAGGPIGEWVMSTVLRSDFAFWLLQRFLPGTLTRLLLATDPRLVAAEPAAERERVSNVLTHILPISRRAEGLVLDGRTAGDPPSYPVETITCPVLAISAKDDLFGTAQSAIYTARQVRSGRLVLFENGGHILAGRQSEVWTAVTSFLNEVLEARPVSSAMEIR